jgi:hypothetical protein
MISVDIFHVDIEALVEKADHLLPCMVFFPSEREVQAAIDIGLYLKAATLAVETADVSSALEITYERTQNLDSQWQFEEGVMLYYGAFRSSMIGDVFVVNGSAYLVAMVGFKPLSTWKTPTATGYSLNLEPITR